ncbi:MAG: hypothetical protein ABEL51_04195 [Salinibacter sp.]
MSAFRNVEGITMANVGVFEEQLAGRVKAGPTLLPNRPKKKSARTINDYSIKHR